MAAKACAHAIIFIATVLLTPTFAEESPGDKEAERIARLDDPGKGLSDNGDKKAKPSIKDSLSTDESWGMRKGMYRLSWGVEGGIARFTPDDSNIRIFTINPETDWSAAGRLGFSAGLTEHFELGGAFSGGPIQDVKGGGGHFVECGLRPVWHFRPNRRIDPYAGARLGTTRLGVGTELNRIMLSGGPVVGMHYYLTRRFSFYTEFGYAYSGQVSTNDFLGASFHSHAGFAGFGFSYLFGKR